MAGAVEAACRLFPVQMDTRDATTCNDDRRFVHNNLLTITVCQDKLHRYILKQQLSHAPFFFPHVL